MMLVLAIAGTIALLVVVGALTFLKHAPSLSAVPVPVVSTAVPVEATPMPAPALVPTVPSH